MGGRFAVGAGRRPDGAPRGTPAMAAEVGTGSPRAMRRAEVLGGNVAP